MAKLDPVPGKEFSAEGYFRASVGPLAPYFRVLIPDYNGIARLERDAQGLPIGLKKEWETELARVTTHYGFDAEQKAAAEQEMAKSYEEASAWFRTYENRWRVQEYFAKLRKIQLIERDPEALRSQKELTWKERPKLNTERKEMMAVLDGWSTKLKQGWEGIATPDQRQAAGSYVPPKSRLEWLNWMTKWGLSIAGVCLILGLFSRLAALYCAGFLLLIYLSVPPWPGLPPSPVAEGNYWIVNKNLVEMIACLVLAFLPTGQWLGLDALLFGWMRRKKVAREIAEQESRDRQESELSSLNLAGSARPGPSQRRIRP